MAYFQRKPSGKIVAYYYDRQHRKPVAIPNLPEDIHQQSDDQIREWLTNWEADAGYGRAKSQRKSIELVDETNRAVSAYFQEKREVGIGERTLTNERQMFDLIFDYFIKHYECQRLQDWHKHQYGLKAWLRDEHRYSEKHKAQTIQTFNRFGVWCRENGFINFPWNVSPYRKSTRNKAQTPLPREVEPAEVLEVARRLPSVQWKIALLAGYFCGLRPEETFELSKSDFITGGSVENRCKTYKRLKSVGLGSRLAVSITKARITGKVSGPPKNYNSNGVVCVWSVDGAKALATILKDVGEECFFPQSKSYLFKLWRRHIFPSIGLTLHDLRRASALYLGRSVGIDPFLLQDMLRHADLETTQLYTRRPEEESQKDDELNFDDII